MSRLPLDPTGTDAFIHAFDGFMHRRSQGVHRSQSILVLSKVPEAASLRAALAQVLALHPILTAWTRKSHPLAIPHFEIAPAPASEIPLTIHPTTQGEPHLAPLCDLLAPYPAAPGYCNIRCDLFPLPGGTAWFVLTWRHQILDAIGAELLLQEIATPGTTPGTSTPHTHKKLAFSELWTRTSPIVNHFWDIRVPRFASPAGPKIRPAQPRNHRITLTPEQSRTVKQRATDACGLIHTPYFLAATTRAHKALFESRGTPQQSYVANIPVQLRKRRARITPIFQNHLSMDFFRVTPEETTDLQKLTAAFQHLQTTGQKNRLSSAFTDLLQLMHRIPPEIYIRFIRTQMHGEYNTFYHSLTGELAPRLKQFHHTEITNAWHLPALYAPPGSGIFANEKNGLLTLVFAWREPGVTRAEIDLMEKHLLADLLG